MNTDIRILNKASEMPSAIESYIHRLFQSINRWFDLGKYEIISSSSKLKLTFQYMEPVIKYLNISYKSVSSYQGDVIFKFRPKDNDILLEYSNEAIHLYLGARGERYLSFYFKPLTHLLKTLYQSPDEIKENFYIPLPDEAQKVYFSQLLRDQWSIMHAKSLETQESLRQELLQFNTENSWRDGRAIFELLKQFHESFVALNHTHLVFSSFHPGHKHLTFNWLVLDPRLSIYYQYIGFSPYDKNSIENEIPDLSKFKMDDIITWGWNLQVMFSH